MINKQENKIINKWNNNKYSDNTFESIKHLDEYGNEYWYVRELQKALDYKEWKILKK